MGYQSYWKHNLRQVCIDTLFYWAIMTYVLVIIALGLSLWLDAGDVTIQDGSPSAPVSPGGWERPQSPPNSSGLFVC
jgi:hypothetical protein